jgi:hypothetical protein
MLGWRENEKKRKTCREKRKAVKENGKQRRVGELATSEKIVSASRLLIVYKTVCLIQTNH